MICRLWHGWTSTENAASYEAYLGDELYPRLERELGIAAIAATTSYGASATARSSS